MASELSKRSMLVKNSAFLVLYAFTLLEKGHAQSSGADNPTSTSEPTSSSSAASSTTTTHAPTTSSTPIMEAIFGKSTPQESAAVGLGISLTIIGLFTIFIGYWVWTKIRNRKRNVGKPTDSETGPPMSRNSSCASSICKTPATEGESRVRPTRRYSSSSGRPAVRPGILRRTSSQPDVTKSSYLTSSDLEGPNTTRKDTVNSCEDIPRSPSRVYDPNNVTAREQ